MKIFTAEYLNGLTIQAQANQRKRQHMNIHESYEEPCQRLFNAIEPNSYIRPHRHADDPKEELLIAVRGMMALVTFDDQGTVIASLCFGSEKNGSALAVGVEVPVNIWHTVIALEPGCILLEVKSGPFEPNNAKEFAPWAPEEGSSAAQPYLERLAESIAGFGL
jgi:cupin fold WbuC family metalloprotein